MQLVLWHLQDILDNSGCAKNSFVHKSSDLHNVKGFSGGQMQDHLRNDVQNFCWQGGLQSYPTPLQGFSLQCADP